MTRAYPMRFFFDSGAGGGGTSAGEPISEQVFTGGLGGTGGRGLSEQAAGGTDRGGLGTGSAGIGAVGSGVPEANPPDSPIGDEQQAQQAQTPDFDPADANQNKPRRQYRAEGTGNQAGEVIIDGQDNVAGQPQE